MRIAVCAHPMQAPVNFHGRPCAPWSSQVHDALHSPVCFGDPRGRVALCVGARAHPRIHAGIASPLTPHVPPQQVPNVALTVRLLVARLLRPPIAVLSHCEPLLLRPATKFRPTPPRTSATPCSLPSTPTRPRRPRSRPRGCFPGQGCTPPTRPISPATASLRFPRPATSLASPTDRLAKPRQ